MSLDVRLRTSGWFIVLSFMGASLLSSCATERPDFPPATGGTPGDGDGDGDTGGKSGDGDGDTGGKSDAGDGDGDTGGNPGQGDGNGDGDGDGDGDTGGNPGEGDGDGDTGGNPGDGDGDGDTGGNPGDGDGDTGGNPGDGDTGGNPGDGDGDTGGKSGDGGGSGGEDGTGGGTDGTGGEVQVTPPEVLTFSPPDGASGVRDNAVLTVTFNEPMDEDSVQNSVSLTNHSGAELSFAWNENGTVLTITPGDLDYATGASANSYELVIESGALDAEGDELERDAGISFSTLRRVSDTLFASGVSLLHSYASSQQADPQTCPLASGTPRVGHHVGLAITFDYIIYTVFDTSALSGAHEIELATFRAQQLAPDAGYYPMGSVLLDSLELGPIDSYTAYYLDVESNAGILTNSAISSVSLTVTAALTAGLDLHPEQQVYRLTHSGAPSNVQAYFSCTGFALDVTYLTP